MFKLALSLATVLVASLACASTPIHVHDGLDYAIPKGSPVKFVSLAQYGVANFQGRFVMSGSYHYGYITNDPSRDATFGQLELYFLPDTAIRKILPYWKERGAVREMRFKNEHDFVTTVISTDDLTKLKEKKIFSVTGRAWIVVENYEASVECDYPTYAVTFVSIERPQVSVASLTLVDQYGC